jgi:hypothetical protein
MEPWTSVQCRNQVLRGAGGVSDWQYKRYQYQYQYFLPAGFQHPGEAHIKVRLKLEERKDRQGQEKEEEEGRREHSLVSLLGDSVLRFLHHFALERIRASLKSFGDLLPLTTLPR